MSDIHHINLAGLDLNLLVVFDALMTEQNVTRAAQRLGLSQPATSNALARLRNLMEDELFIRTATGLSPTPKAFALVQQLRPALQQIQSALLDEPNFDPATSDRNIIARYNRAFEKGWRSLEWQEIPTLPDFVKFCTRERLNLRSFEDIDRQALNQIQNQVSALLSSRLGKAIARPSTFSPEPAIKFFALSGLTNEQDAYLMAINAHTACIRNALSHPKSLFIGDELSVLLRKDGFAQVIGETCATGRKEGIAVLLLSQDPDTICECATGAQIMQNMTYRITGRITSTGVASFERYLGYPANIISQNATEAFLPRISDLYSCWLVETGGRFWRTRFYPGEMMLASVANNQDEREARSRVMAQYPNTPKGRLLGLRAFTDAYICALKENKGFQHIGQEVSMVNTLHSRFNSGEQAENRSLIAS